MNNAKEPRRKFTGYHATAMFMAFFGVIIAVNFTMAGLAISGFGGTVVDNSYVASQKYNDWLAQGRAQDAHGWTIEKPERTSDKLQLRIADEDGTALDGASVVIIADHPVGKAVPFELDMRDVGNGTYRSSNILPGGRWKLKIEIRKEDQGYKLLSEVK